MMLKPSNIAALALLAAIAANTVNAAEKVAEQEKNTVATVNGVAIPQSRIDMRIKVAAQQGQPDSPEMRKAIRDDLINLEVISQEALKKGLDKQPDVAQQ
ncbi:MAG: SurA N-terminal domain-containing protein, partial [Gallionellaceae bacterium]